MIDRPTTLVDRALWRRLRGWGIEHGLTAGQTLTLVITRFLADPTPEQLTPPTVANGGDGEAAQ